MMLSKRIIYRCSFHYSSIQQSSRRRMCSAKSKPVLALDEDVNNSIEKEAIKPRHHPGIFKPRTVTLPDFLVKSIETSLEDYPVKALVEESHKLTNHLRGRVPSMEQPEIKELRDQIHKRIEDKVFSNPANEGKDTEILNQSVSDKVLAAVRKKVYHWTPIDYDAYTCLLYLVGRFTPEYAVLTKIFGEIAQRDPQFKPKNVLDFGSGVGTVTWAAKQYWERDIFEYFNIDSSSFMNDLALTLLQAGRENKTPLIKGVFYRQFFPTTNRPYDLVVSAYSLLELPTFQNRIETIIKLWNQTTKYLVVIEQGTNGGFHVINQVRDYILQIKDPKHKGHVFSPCPHDELCPRYLTGDNTPCNFQVKYFSLPLKSPSTLKKELYSYVVLKKGERKSDELQWPRVVRECLIRSRHTICRLCTAKGTLEEVIVTPSKHGKAAYRCAKATEWGDMLPIKIEDT